MMLPADLAATIARAGVDPTLSDRALVDALRGAIADRRSYVAWDVDEVGWRVELLQPERECFDGQTLATALARCLVWLMRNEHGAVMVGEVVPDTGADGIGVLAPRGMIQRSDDSALPDGERVLDARTPIQRRGP
jgi:hypothetical protein